MSNEISQVRAAFREAASALGFVFSVPPVAQLEGISEHLIGHVTHFGSLKGCAPLLVGAPTSAIAAVQAAGYYCSQLSLSYGQFEGNRFSETLNDWGFFGPAYLRPSWCVGNAAAS